MLLRFKPKNISNSLSYINGNVYSKLKLYNNCNKLKLSFNNLEIDKYLENNNPPKRLRAFTRYDVYIDNNKVIINHDNDNIFNQNVNDYRNKTRIFKPIDESLIHNKFIVKLLYTTIDIIKYNNPSISQLKISLHQIRSIVYPNEDTTNSPEGIHKDGADFIVSAFVINKVNIKGGESIIMDEGKVSQYSTYLDENQGIFQEDKNLWHYITSSSSSYFF